MTWMLTATGAEVDLRFMNGADISITAIAHHLAQLNRFTGACVRPYSVAEHSLFVVEILRVHGVTDRRVLLYGLLHDAHEAYTADLSSPMKQVVGDAWAAAEGSAEHAVLKHFGLLTTRAVHREAIKWADMCALRTERHQLLPAGATPWPCEFTHDNQPWWDFAARAHMSWTDWRRAFLDEFANLTYPADADTETPEEITP